METLLSGQVTYRVPLPCITCGRVFYSRHRMELTGQAAGSVGQAVKQDFRTKSPDIPEGWRMDGRKTIYCPSCRPDALPKA